MSIGSNILSFFSGKKPNSNHEIYDSIIASIKIKYVEHKTNGKYSIKLVDVMSNTMKCFDCKSHSNALKIIELLSKSEYPLIMESSQSQNSQFIEFNFSNLK